MNRLAWLLRPAFEWNHDYVMRAGARGLAKDLGVTVDVVEQRRRRRWPLYAAAGAVAAAGGAAVLRRR
jgi:hypothetical protein